MPRLVRYSRTPVARRSPSARLYSAVPMLQVWPSIWIRSVGSSRSAVTASSSTRVASGRSEYRSKSKCTSSNVYTFGVGRVTVTLTVSDAIRLSVGHVTVTVIGTVAASWPAVHTVSRAVGLANVPLGALHRYVTAQLIELCTVAVTVDGWPICTVGGLAVASTVRVCTTGAGGGG